ncbi:PP2C family protein-serine/threonine phosphatase [Occallatibacter savannae]|uniref:PP2C family protein-serine/threonine phosphatase n=1 Tax=Occallatibacter savannae TaxID=1002691 RepID=UPI0013A58838|nr:PP2C family protein-serine/threonine phosphatase [Occallatibacter savannae]
MPLFFLLAAAAAPGAESRPVPPICLDGVVTGAIALIGPWKFQVGDDPRWASPSFDDSEWSTIRGDLPWGRQGFERYTGYGWYRIHLFASCAPENAQRFSLLVPQIHDVYEIFWNGNPVGGDGKMPPWPQWRVSQQPRVFAIEQGTSGLLAFRVWKAPLFSDDSGEQGGFDSAPVIGSPNSITAAKAVIDYDWLQSRQLRFGESLTFGLIALLSFLAWWRNRAQWLVLWMACYALTPVLAGILRDAHLAWPYSVAMGLLQPVHSLHDVSLWLLLLWLMRLNEDRAVFRVVISLSIISIVITSIDGILLSLAWNPAWLFPVQAGDAAITTVSTLIQILPVLLVSLAIYRRKHLKPASWIVAALAFSDGMFIAIQQALKQGQRFTGWTIGDQLERPFLLIDGNAVSAATLARALLLIAIVSAVYISYRDEQRHELLLENEFSSARELQRILIPENQHRTPGFDISSSYKPALQVGGDFFQLIPSVQDPNGSTLLLLGDVSGHGLKAALSVSYVIATLRILADLFADPGPLLTELNRRLCGQMDHGFVTCIAVRIDRLGECTMSSAGHPPPFLNWRSLEIPGALPLGLDPAAHYDQRTMHFSPGDHLALYTDGLLEARNKAGELYGFSRLQKLFAATPSASEAAEEAVRFGQDDDVTVVTLAYVGESKQADVKDEITPELAPQ